MTSRFHEPFLKAPPHRATSYAPQLELLEARLPPGDLGFAGAWLLPSWAQAFAAAPLPAAREAGPANRVLPSPESPARGPDRATQTETVSAQLARHSDGLPSPAAAGGWTVLLVGPQDPTLGEVLNHGVADPVAFNLFPSGKHCGQTALPASDAKPEGHAAHTSAMTCGCPCCCAALHGTPTLSPLRLAPPEPVSAGLQLRKNQADLTSEEIHAFVDAVKQLKNTFREGAEASIYDEYVQVHILAMMEFNIHDGPSFLPWHRALVRSFELELQALNPDVTIPYWDFTIDNTPEASLWAEDFLGGNGDPEDSDFVKTGPFRQDEWSPTYEDLAIRRHFGGWFQINLPTPEDVAGAFQVTRYDAPPYDTSSDITLSFRNYVAGWNHPSGESEMHNRVHEWMGGSMMGMASPNDPVFWLLHANIDRVWAQWQDYLGQEYEPVEGGPEGHNLYDVMPFVGVTPADMLDHRALGYDYAA